MPSPSSTTHRLRQDLGRSVALAILLACSADPTRPVGADDGPGDDDMAPEAQAPPAPEQLQAAGSLRNIHLSWRASPGAAGYQLYRSADGVEFTRLAQLAPTTTSVDDPIESPAGDGILYRYKVTAVGEAESGFSNTAQTVHGTRLVSQSFFFATRADKSPYVAEGTTRITTGLEIDSGTKLYVLDGAVIDLGVFRDSIEFDVRGLIRSVRSGGAPAVFTAHRELGGALLDGDGLQFVFEGVPYDPRDDSGSMLEHVQMEHLSYGLPGNILRGGMVVRGSGRGIKLRNVKLFGARSDGVTRLSLEGGWIILEDSYLDRLPLSIASDVRSTPFGVRRNVFRRAQSIVLDIFRNDPAVNPGQIENNDLDGVFGVGWTGPTRDDLVLVLPVGNNYWAGGSGTPPVPTGGLLGSGAQYSNPGAPLAEPPPAGPDW